jgi:hypothetical protein
MLEAPDGKMRETDCANTERPIISKINYLAKKLTISSKVIN